MSKPGNLNLWKFYHDYGTPVVKPASYLCCEHACYEQIPKHLDLFKTEPLHYVSQTEYEREMWFRVFYGDPAGGWLEYGVAMIREYDLVDAASTCEYRFKFHSVRDDELLFIREKQVKGDIGIPKFMETHGRDLLEEYFRELDSRNDDQ